MFEILKLKAFIQFQNWKFMRHWNKIQQLNFCLIQVKLKALKSNTTIELNSKFNVSFTPRSNSPLVGVPFLSVSVLLVFFFIMLPKFCSYSFFCCLRDVPYGTSAYVGKYSSFPQWFSSQSDLEDFDFELECGLRLAFDTLPFEPDFFLSNVLLGVLRSSKLDDRLFLSKRARSSGYPFPMVASDLCLLVSDFSKNSESDNISNS